MAIGWFRTDELRIRRKSLTIHVPVPEQSKGLGINEVNIAQVIITDFLITGTKFTIIKVEDAIKVAIFPGEIFKENLTIRWV